MTGGAHSRSYAFEGLKLKAFYAGNYTTGVTRRWEIAVMDGTSANRIAIAYRARHTGIDGRSRSHWGHWGWVVEGQPGTCYVSLARLVQEVAYSHVHGR